MKSRNELAAQFLAGMLADPNVMLPAEGPVHVAFRFADAFLAAAGEREAEQREPDAVWGLEVLLGSGVRRLLFNDNHPVAVNPELVDGLLAGRERVRLWVYVEEVES